MLSTARVLFPLARLLESPPASAAAQLQLTLHGRPETNEKDTVLHTFPLDLSQWKLPPSMPATLGVRGLGLEHGPEGTMLSLEVASGNYDFTLAFA